MKTTLEAIRAKSPCTDGYKKLCKHLGYDFPSDKKFNVSEIIKSNDIDDTLWIIGNVLENKKLLITFACDCAEHVLPIFEKKIS